MYDPHGDWVPYQGYQEPKQSMFWQVFDVLFIWRLSTRHCSCASCWPAKSSVKV